MHNRIKILFILGPIFLMGLAGCQKGTFDINSPNPNVPSVVPAKFVLSSALAGSALLQYGGGQTDLMNTYMGYLSISGGYIPNIAWETYNVTTDFGSANWDNAYPVLENYVFIENLANQDSSQANFGAIARIMLAYHFSRLVDVYNDIPYSAALQGANGILFPSYDKGSDVYTALIHQLDTAIIIINNGAGVATNPGSQDIMFGGQMSQWIQFANTVKLRMLLNLTQTANGPTTIQTELAGLNGSSFLGAGEDAIINPGYTNSNPAQQTPIWQTYGFSPTGAANGDENYLVACSYIVNFWSSTNDTSRPQQVFCLNNSGVVQGRAFGSNNGTETSPNIISLLGYYSYPGSAGPYTSGLVVSPTAGSVLFPAFESLFLQAEAAQRGYLSIDPVATYESAVSESYRLLSVPNYQTSATAYYSQPGNAQVNIVGSANPITTIITQKWAALILYDPLESWCDWRRLGIPASLPVSIFPGTTATHIPYRLLYPTSEYKYNALNVAAEGTINALTSKIFWQP